MIEYETVEAILTEAGVNPEQVRSMEIDHSGVRITLFFMTEDGIRLNVDGDELTYTRNFDLHRAGDHVHGEDFDGHTHE